jgi:hypothetical protein
MKSAKHPHAQAAGKYASQTRWAKAHPLEKWAHSCLRSAIKRGLILPGPCEVCGSTEVDGHHADYLKPMEVSWLCRLHHRRLHAEIRRAS